MKKYLSIILILTLLISCFTFIPSYGASLIGNGTKEDPYIINSALDFMEIKNNPSAYYILNNDIVLPAHFVPFEFSGTLIGNDTEKLPFITANIVNPDSSSGSPLGLFTVLSGNVRIENICLKGSITGGSYVGGFAGSATPNVGSVIKNCINEAIIRGVTYVGGIVANTNANLLIENCINAGNIYADTYAGGIAGLTSTGTINLCRNVANVTAQGSYAGGIVARNYGYVNYCANSGNVKANSFAGGIIAVVNGKRSSEYIYNIGTVEARTSSEHNDCGGLIGGVPSGTGRYVTITNGYNGGDVISPYGNYNPIHPTFIVGSDTNYVKLDNVIYLSDNNKDDNKEGSTPVSGDQTDVVDEFLGNFHSILDKTISSNNTKWMDNLLSQLGCELAMFAGNRVAVINNNGTAQMIRTDDNDISIVPKVVNSTTMVPVEFISRIFGADVKWNGNNNSVEIITDKKQIFLYIGEKTATVNGEAYQLTGPCYIENGRTFVPIRAIAEMLDKYVYWHESGIILIGKNKMSPSEEFIKLAKGIWIIPAEDLTVKLKSALPGDEIIVANGTYKDVIVDVDIYATEEKPLIIRAETPGGVEFTGASRFTITGSYITVRDFYFNEAISDSETVRFYNAYNCRFTGNYLYMCGHTTSGQYGIVVLEGNSKYNRFDHNTFERPHGMCIRLNIETTVPRERNVTDNRIDHNYFLDVRQCSVEMPTSSANGMEVVNILNFQGYDIDNIIEYNRFEDIYGDGGEGICLKSNGNKVNYNTFVNSRMSGLSMRANENSEVIGNFFFKTKYGLRIFGNGHVFKDNYLYDSYRSGFVAHGGSHSRGEVGDGPNQAASDFYAENNLTIYPNHAGIMLGDNFNADNGLADGPSNIVFKNNLFYLDTGTVLKDYRSSNITYEGNKVNLSGSAVMGAAKEGFEETDVPLVFDGEIWLPENMLDFDKQGLISVSECGPEDRWWEPLLRYTPKYFFDIEPDKTPVSLTPSSSSIKISTAEEYNLKGLNLTANYDDDYLYNKGINKNYEDISYTTDNPELKIKDGFLSSDKPGEYILKLGYKGLSCQVNVTVLKEYAGNNLLSDNFDDGDISSYHTQSGNLWDEKGGTLKSKDSSQIINDSKVLKGNYEANFDITLTNDSGSGDIGGGFIFGYRNTPDLSYYTLRFGGTGVITSGIYEVDPHVTLKSSEMLIDFEPNKKYNITVRVNDDIVVVLVDGKIATVLENFKNKEGKIGFISYSNNSVIIDNLNVSSITNPVNANNIADLDMTVKRIDSTMAVVDFTPLEQKGIYYRTYRNGFQINDSLDENEGFTEVTLRAGEKIDYQVKGFDEYGNIVGNGYNYALYETDGKEEFFTISDVMVKTGNSTVPYAEGRIKYRSRGLTEGLTTYSDRTYVISNLPDRFKDCGFIKINNADIKKDIYTGSAKNGDYLRFKMNRSATIYILAYGNFTETPDWLMDWEYEQINDVILTTSNPTNCWSKHFEVPEGQEITVYLGAFPKISVAHHVYIKPDVMPEYVELKKIPKGLF